jgi:hypothetical protein
VERESLATEYSTGDADKVVMVRQKDDLGLLGECTQDCEGGGRTVVKRAKLLGFDLLDRSTGELVLILFLRRNHRQIPAEMIARED